MSVRGWKAACLVGLALASALAIAAHSQTPIADDDFEAFLFDEDWTPTVAIAKVRAVDESAFALTITLADASLECSEAAPQPGTRVVLDEVPWRPMGRYTTRDARVVATRDREGAPRTHGFADGGFRLLTRTRTPPEANQTFIVELDLDDVAATQSYARGQVTVRVCP